MPRPLTALLESTRRVVDECRGLLCAEYGRDVLAHADALAAERDNLRRIVAVALRVLEAAQEPSGGEHGEPLAAALDELTDAVEARRFDALDALLARIAELEAERDRLTAQVAGYQSEVAEVDQTLGRALHMPLAGPEIGGDGARVETGEHTPAALADEAARRIGELEAALAHFWNHTLCPCGARRESPRTHPHVISCPVGVALAGGA